MDVIDTERLVLTPLMDADIDGIERIFGHPAVMSALGTASFGRRDAEQLVTQHALQFGTKGFAPLGARRRDTGELVGRIGLWWAPHLDVAELGWVLHPSVHGVGLATEGALAVLDDARRRLGVAEIVSLIAVGNDASIAVAERLGATWRGYVPGGPGQLATSMLFEHAPGRSPRWAALPRRLPSRTATLAWRARAKLSR
jgi:RimJ/RimL family protein N-acetyltransferase